MFLYGFEILCSINTESGLFMGDRFKPNINPFTFIRRKQV